MPLPAAVTTVTLHGRIVDHLGAPATGRVSFSMPYPLRDGDDNVIVGAGIVSATLDANGEFTVTLIATDDPDLSPSGWVYAVTISTSAWRARFSIEVPRATVGTLELADIAPASSPPTVVTYLLASARGATSGVASLDADGLVPADQLPTGGGGAVDSVNGHTGVVVLAAADVGAATPTSVTAAVAAHVAATDPHGDRAAASAALAGHEADTTGVHGITDTAALETTTGATAKVTAHAGATDPHGDRAYADSGLAGKQPLDSDLTAIAALAPADDSVIQRKSGLWVARSMAQVKTDLAVTASDVGAVPTARQVIAGTGLTGGGALSADVTLTVGYGTTSTTATVGNDSRVTGAAQKASNLSDLGSVSTARTNLGLGAAALLAVGTTTGTVAAGDDSRVTGAAQKSANLSDLASAATARGNLGVERSFAMIPRAAYIQAGGAITTRSSKAVTLNAMYLEPYCLQSAANLTSLAFELTSSTATAVARLGIYAADPSTFLPTGAAVVDFGTFTADTTGLKTCAVSQALAAGVGWLAIVFQTAAPSVRHGGGWNPYVSSASFPTGAGAGWNVAYVQTGVTGGLPTIGALSDTDAPVVGMKF